jgi:hypothetical protein
MLRASNSALHHREKLHRPDRAVSEALVRGSGIERQPIFEGAY